MAAYHQGVLKVELCVGKGTGVAACDHRLWHDRHISQRPRRRLTNVAADKHFSDAASPQLLDVLAAELRR